MTDDEREDYLVNEKQNTLPAEHNDLKTLVAIREILGSALREMDTLSVGYRVNYLVSESEGRIAGAYGYIDTAIRKLSNEQAKLH